MFRSNRKVMNTYEDSLADSSLASRAIRSSIQYVMTRWLGADNDKTYCITACPATIHARNTTG